MDGFLRQHPCWKSFSRISPWCRQRDRGLTLRSFADCFSCLFLLTGCKDFARSPMLCLVAGIRQNISRQMRLHCLLRNSRPWLVARLRAIPSALRMFWLLRGWSFGSHNFGTRCDKPLVIQTRQKIPSYAIHTQLPAAVATPSLRRPRRLSPGLLAPEPLLPMPLEQRLLQQKRLMVMQ